MTKKDQLTKKELIEDLQRIKEKIGKTPSIEDYKEHGKYSLTAYTHSKWDTWNEAKKEAGLKVRYPAFSKIPKDELLTELRKIWMETGYRLTAKDVREKSQFSINTYQRRFENGLEQAKKEAKIKEKDKEQLFQKWAENLNEENLWGRYTQQELKQYFPKFNPNNYSEFLEWNQKQENGLELGTPKINSNKGQRQLFVKTNGRDFKDHIQNEYSDDIPEGYEDIFREYIGKGYSPNGILGTLQYLTEEISQEENDYCVAVTVRNLKNKMFEDGYRDRFPDNYKLDSGSKKDYSSGKRVQLNISTDLRDKLKEIKKEDESYKEVLKRIIEPEIVEQHCEICGRADKNLTICKPEKFDRDMFVCDDCVEKK